MVGDIQNRFCYDLAIMDDLLSTRYQSLFQSYAMGETGAVLPLKRRIVEWNLKNEGRLRWDAALFLLTNLDHMIVRPYFGVISTDENRLLPLPKEVHFNEWFERAQSATELILERLGQGKQEISSHDVLRTIDANWERLALMFGWG